MAHASVSLALALSTLLHALLGCSICGECATCARDACAVSRHQEADHEHDEEAAHHEGDGCPTRSASHPPRDHCVFVSKLFAGDDGAGAAGVALGADKIVAPSVSLETICVRADRFARVPPSLASPSTSLPLHLQLQVLLL